MRCSAMPKSVQVCSTSLSSSSNAPSSNSSSSRSRAESFPSACWRATRSSPPPASAWLRRRRSSSSFSCSVMGEICVRASARSTSRLETAPIFAGDDRVCRRPGTVLDAHHFAQRLGCQRPRGGKRRQVLRRLVGDARKLILIHDQATGPSRRRGVYEVDHLAGGDASLLVHFQAPEAFEFLRRLATRAHYAPHHPGAGSHPTAAANTAVRRIDGVTTSSPGWSLRAQ